MVRDNREMPMTSLIARLVQKAEFALELSVIARGNVNYLAKLHSFVDEITGILRVGKRQKKNHHRCSLRVSLSHGPPKT